MTIYLTNTQEIAARGGHVLGDDDFVVVVSNCCGRQWLYDEEVLRLFTDPADLSQPILNIEGEAPETCPSCGEKGWNFGNSLSSHDDVEAGPWSWAL